MTKRKIIGVSSIVSAVIIVLTVFLVKAHRRNVLYERLIENNNQRAFGELVSSVADLDSALQKCVYASSPSMVSAVCTQVYGKALSAQMALGELPNSFSELENAASFITKVGDYAFALSRNASNGEGYTDEEYTNLVSLSKSANALTDNLNQMYADMRRGGASISQLAQAGEQADHTAPSGLTDGFKMIETEFPEIPTLIYDGPFSDHISGMSPIMTQGQKEIDEGQAVKIAADFTGLKESTLTCHGARQGELPVYTVTAGENGGQVTVEVTVQGGYVSYYENNRAVGESAMTRDDAVAAANGFLIERGIEGMKPTYETLQSGVLTVNFAYNQDKVICYNDLIKVSVAMDNGRIVGYEAKGYITCHHEREIPDIEVTRDEAQELVSTDLNIISHRMAIIPTMGKNEVFCHEFKCENSEKRHYIIYVNAVTGNQENILILIEDENGTLTI